MMVCMKREKAKLEEETEYEEEDYKAEENVSRLGRIDGKAA